MRATTIGAFGVIALIALCGNAAAFDCSNPGNPAVAVVCSDPELIQLTQERQRVWKALHDRVQGEERQQLVENERDWLTHYPQACGVAGNKPPATIDDNTRACFKRADEERIAWLRAYGKPGSAAAAAAPAPSPASPPAPAAAPPPPTPTPAPVQSAALPQPAAPAAPAPEPAKPVTRTAAAAPAGVYHLNFTFACQTPQKLSQVLGALQRNDIGYALSQTDCLPVPAGREANLLSVAGNVAKIRLCSADAGCTEVYADASKVIDPAGQPLAK
jgi:hypothetical protein